MDRVVLIFLDFETTGVTAKDKIVSAAVVSEREKLYELFNEGKKIPAEASSIHHITNEMIADKKSFIESEIYDFLQKHNSEESLLVAHNITFHQEFLASHGIFWRGSLIDTQRVTKHLIPECENFSLQFLRYELKLYRSEQRSALAYGIKDALVAHHALSDAIITKLLFEMLQELTSEDNMVALSFKSVLLEKFSFGKYKGHYVEEIVQSDYSYVVWLLNSATDMDEDMRYTLNHYLQG